MSKLYIKFEPQQNYEQKDYISFKKDNNEFRKYILENMVGSARGIYRINKEVFESQITFNNVYSN